MKSGKEKGAARWRVNIDGFVLKPMDCSHPSVQKEVCALRVCRRREMI